MTTDYAISFDLTGGESEVLVATREVRNSQHSHGTLAVGARVFFRREEPSVGQLWYLAYESDGSPTDGSEYARFSGAQSAAAFARTYGLAPAGA